MKKLKMFSMLAVFAVVMPFAMVLVACGGEKDLTSETLRKIEGTKWTISTYFQTATLEFLADGVGIEIDTFTTDLYEDYGIEKDRLKQKSAIGTIVTYTKVND